MNIVDASSIEDLRMALAEMKTAIEFDQKELNEQQKKDIDRLASKAERMLVNDHLITSQQLLHVANSSNSLGHLRNASQFGAKDLTAFINI